MWCVFLAMLTLKLNVICPFYIVEDNNQVGGSKKYCPFCEDIGFYGFYPWKLGVFAKTRTKIHILQKYIVWSKMIRNCHCIREEKLQKNCCQRHFVAQSILDKPWKFQPDSSNGTPIWSNRTKAVARTPTQLAANRLRTARWQHRCQISAGVYW